MPIVSSGQISSRTNSRIQSSCAWNSGSVEKSHAMSTTPFASSVVSDRVVPRVRNGELGPNLVAQPLQHIIPPLVPLALPDGLGELGLPGAVGRARTIRRPLAREDRAAVGRDERVKALFALERRAQVLIEPARDGREQLGRVGTILHGPHATLRPVRFADLAATSEAVARDPLARRKAELLAAALRQLGPEEVEAGVAYLAATPRQRRTGVGWAALRELPRAGGRIRASTVAEVDAAFARIAALAGAGLAGRAARGGRDAVRPGDGGRAGLPARPASPATCARARWQA